jgi:SH3-like domain-containing protein
MLLRIFITLLFCLSTHFVYAGQGGFPFVGSIKPDKVNVRAGQSTNFEKIAQLAHDDEVLVIGKEFAWYKIKLPKQANSFIADKYVQTEDKLTGIVTADRVNIRAAKDVNSSSLGQAMKGMTVKIVESWPGWYRIEPLEDSFGWVSEEFVTLKSKDVSSFKPKEVNVAASAPAAIAQIPEANQKFVTAGFLEPVDSSDTAGGAYYRIVVDGQPMYVIKADNHVLDSFLFYKVSCEGMRVQEPPISTYLPVLSISKIQLIL